MSLKILSYFDEIEFEVEDSSGHRFTATNKSGFYAASEGTRHRRKPNPLDVTRFVIETSDAGEGIHTVTIRYPFSWTRYTGIPISGCYSRFAVSRRESKTDDGRKRLASALGKMAGSDFNFGETLVELDQSFSMVNNSLRRLYLYFSYAKRGNIQGIRDLLKSSDYRLRGVTPKKRLANAYLEYSFGWSPLINDVYTALTQTHKLVTSRGAEIRRYSGRALGIRHDDFWSSDVSRAGASGIIKNTRLSVANQLGITNPALMAWNRLPFSFLVDWVIPISSYLSALTWDAGLISQRAYKVDVRKHRSVVRSVSDPDDVPINVGDVHSLAARRIRTPVNSRFVVPDLSSNSFQLSLSKIATLAALFTQLNSR